MILIGLNGRLHSGKDTAVQFIRAAAGPQCKVARAGFADKLKLSGMRALGFHHDDLAGAVALADVCKESGFVKIAWKENNVLVSATISGREFWQFYGTEAHRDVFGEDVWVDALLPVHSTRSHTFAQFPYADVLVVTDVRFPNEAKRILDLGGHVWHIDADTRLGPLPDDAHPSEHPLPDSLLTCKVPNNGTLEQFEAAVTSTWNLGGPSC